MLAHSKRQLNALKDRIVEGDGQTKQSMEELVSLYIFYLLRTIS
jgi:rRNA processing protein Krr1/Pno1